MVHIKFGTIGNLGPGESAQWSPSRCLRRSTILGVVVALLAGNARTQTQPRDLTQVNVEDLLNVQVTSVSKKEQKLSKAGAAVFVITQEDIRRSGATNIPDLLRMAPGVDVARIDNTNWAVSIRGFNDLYANKVLVLIDGRSVYSPLFSGVFWDQQDVPLEDIDRIEVIRGPGGTVWGANAVNGVINIITKSAGHTQGGRITAGGGSEHQDALLQYGGNVGGAGAYRVFGRYNYTNRSASLNGGQAPDVANMLHAGFRSDWDLSSRDKLMVTGDLMRSEGGSSFNAIRNFQFRSLTGPSDSSVGNVQTRWDRDLANGSQISLQGYYNYGYRINKGVEQWTSIADLEFEHRLQIGERNEIVWGLGYRVSNSVFHGNESIAFHPTTRTDPLYSVFVQDEIKLTGTLALTLGSKFEYNNYSGYEGEPSAQVVWTPSDRHTLWASAAKAIRQPSRVDYGLDAAVSATQLPNNSLGVVEILGNFNPRAEELRDYEAGYRAQLNRRLSLDFTGFVSLYRHLETREPETPHFVSGPAPYLALPFVFDDKAHAIDYGGEFFANWHAANFWKLSPGVTLLNMSVQRDMSSRDTTVEQLPGYSPRRQWQVRSFFTLPHHWEWDQTIGYTGHLVQGNIPGYVRLDSRIGWHVGESAEFSIVGQNLLQPRHAEFPDVNQFIHTLDERSVFAKVTWRF